MDGEGTPMPAATPPEGGKGSMLIPGRAAWARPWRRWYLPRSGARPPS